MVESNNVTNVVRGPKKVKSSEIKFAVDEKPVYGDSSIDEKGDITFYASRRVKIQEAGFRTSKFGQLGFADLAKIVSELIRKSRKMYKLTTVHINSIGFNNTYPLLAVLDHLHGIFEDELKSETLDRIFKKS